MRHNGQSESYQTKKQKIKFEDWDRGQSLQGDGEKRNILLRYISSPLSFDNQKRGRCRSRVSRDTEQMGMGK